MARPLRVFGAYQDSTRIIMATTSITAFERAVNKTRGYASETHNDTEIAAALAQPNIVLIRPSRGNAFEVATVAYAEKPK